MSKYYKLKQINLNNQDEKDLQKVCCCCHFYQCYLSVTATKQNKTLTHNLNTFDVKRKFAKCVHKT